MQVHLPVNLPFSPHDLQYKRPVKDWSIQEYVRVIALWLPESRNNLVSVCAYFISVSTVLLTLLTMTRSKEIFIQILW